MKYISHRGESMDAPENTLEAFKLSLERHSDGMECDIRLTADNVLVTAHDNTALRTGKVDIVIEESTYEELRKVDVSNGRNGYSNVHIPRFADTLQYLGRRREYFVEIKENDPAVIHAMIRELDAAAIPEEQVTMISFQADIVKLYKELYPQRKALFLEKFRVYDDGRWEPTADQLIDKLSEIKADGVDIKGVLTFINADYVKKVQAAGYEFAVWTVDDKESAGIFKSYGVNTLTSNCAAYLRDTLG